MLRVQFVDVAEFYSLCVYVCCRWEGGEEDGGGREREDEEGEAEGIMQSGVSFRVVEDNDT